jgi:LuxR family maltose regulon positive regulatory protein
MNAEKSVKPKISPPIVAYDYYCTELLDLLDELRSKQLIIINGPPGIGKSTLVATYIETRNLTSIWYQIDKDDNDLATFFYCLDIAIHEEKPNKNFSLPHFSRRVSQEIAEFSKLYFQELYQHLEIPFLIVLDDYQELADAATLHKVVQAACSELPKGGRIVIITEKKYPLPLAPLRAKNMVAVIESQDFQLSPSKVI